jgi:NAD(P)-dependent dehydrogenase (short-subunit alcohol dehydrogenase family)
MVDEGGALKLLKPVHELAATTDTAAALSRHVWFEGRKCAPSRSVICDEHRERRSRACYACKKPEYAREHGFYTAMCAECGAASYERLMQTADLRDLHALVIGGRTKIGYQVVLRLLRCGATVTATTRFPDRCVFAEEVDYDAWAARLTVLPLDLNQGAKDTAAAVQAVVDSMSVIDALIIVAAQTIRGAGSGVLSPEMPRNRYGDAKNFVGDKSSWEMRFCDVEPEELEEVLRVNTQGPFLIAKAALPKITASTHLRACIITTHAREGMFGVTKSDYHPHTNVAKAGLHMVTHMLQVGERVPVYGIDPGWISLDEYRAGEDPWKGRLPLTELDGAAKITDPLIAPRMPLPSHGTIQHYLYSRKPVF